MSKLLKYPFSTHDLEKALGSNSKYVNMRINVTDYNHPYPLSYEIRLKTSSACFGDEQDSFLRAWEVSEFLEHIDFLQSVEMLDD